jgi:SAM-dependent methyltransferase
MNGLRLRLGSLRHSLSALLLGVGCTKTAPPPTSPGQPEHHGPHGAAAAGHGPHGAAAAGHGPNAAHDGHAHAHHHRFEDAEAWAEQFDDPSRDAWQRPEAVLEFMALAPDAVVADLGAGTGYFAVRLARRVPQGRVLANDVEPDMVRYLGDRATKEGLANLVPVQGKPDDPALPEAVDVAFMCNVAHHIEDRPAFFRKLAARLRPGGRVVIVDFQKDAPDDVPGPPPAMRVAQDVLVAELAQAGLTLTRADGEVLPHQYIVELQLAKR